MSDRYGFDFNNDGKVSFTESHMTYHIERQTAQKGYISSSLSKSASGSHTGGTSSSSGGSASPSKAADNVGATKKSHTGLIVFLIIIGIIIICVVNSFIAKQKAYNDVIDKIQQGHYFDAICDLRELGWSDPDRKYYKVLDTLENYCWGLDYYKNGDYIMATDHLEKCVGRMSSHTELRSPDDILQEIKPLEEEQIAENHRRAEEQELIREENWRKNGAPYVGMNESEITKTSIGKYSKTGGNYKGSKRCNLYYWFNSKGEQIYSVRCCDGEVIQVWDDRDDPRSFKVNSTKPYYNSSNYDDEYNVKDYYSAEDFYDDHYDDFFDYYDAEDYYEEHGGF